MKTDYKINDSDIAIIAMTGRFPGARNIDEFWQNLCDGRETVSFFSEEELKTSGVPDNLIKDPNYVNAGGVLEDIEMFDAAFFNYSNREAQIMDPQQRLFLECVLEVLEKAGYNPQNYKGLIGSYAGAGENTYLLNNLWKNNDKLKQSISEQYQLIINNSKDFLSTRVSYKLNLKGPSITIQTACSTSLVAVHLACQSLLNWECDMALAGGVSIRIPQKTGYLYEKGMIPSSDGHCRVFDEKADGTVPGNGVGIVLLKRLSDAVSDRDSIQAIIKASAVNNDGSLKVGYTAPSIEGQAAVIEEAHAMAELDPETITYIEAHGTGTELGDPIEIKALTRAFRLKTQKKQFCAIGSLKSNIGHLDTAAGVAGLIKTVLALKHKTIPASLHFEEPNPKINFADTPFYVNDKLTKWKTKKDIPRRAAVSSFGIGGTNCHVILEEAPYQKRSIEKDSYRLLVISAKTESALEKATTDLARYLKQNPKLNLADVAYTLQIGRKHFNFRKFLVCKNIDDAALKLISGKGVYTGLYKREQSDTQPNDKDAIYDFNTKTGLLALGKKWLKGAEIDWSLFYKGEKPRRISLPTYPFERKFYWAGDETELYKKPDIADWFYILSWKKLPLLVKAENNNIYNESSCLIFLDGTGIGNMLAEKLKQTRQKVITVKTGSQFIRFSEYEYSINPEQKEDYESLCRALNDERLKTIIHLWSVTNDYDSILTSERLNKAQNMGFYSLLFLTGSIGKQRFIDKISIFVISNNMQGVIGEELLCPEKATLLGPVKVIPQEYRNIACRSIDIVLPKSGKQKLIENLITEVMTESSDTIIVYRGNNRWVQIFEPVRLDSPKNKPPFMLKERGVYLITGGLGNIGLTLAEYLAKTVQAKLILLGRSSFPDKSEWGQWLSNHDTEDSIGQKIIKLLEIEKLGSKVMIAKADVANYQELQQAITKAEKRFGPINGVIHAAGIIGEASFQYINVADRSKYEQHFLSKVYGLLVIERILLNKKPDFCLLMSSLASILGGLGFAAYSAANAFMDAFAHQHNKNRCRYLSINWDSWQVKEKKSIAPIGKILERLAIKAKEGINALERVLSYDRVKQVIISTGNLSERIHHRWVKRDSSSIHGTPSLTSYVAPRDKIEQTLADIWKGLLGIEQVGIDDNFFELGGDSLLGIDLISKVRAAFNVDLYIGSLLEKPTINLLARHICELQRAPGLFTPLVRVKQNPNKVPIFFVHPGSGNLLCYRDLFPLFDNSKAIFGLQAFGKEPGAKPLTKIEDMAAKYIEAIQPVLRGDTCILAGFCVGGTIAYEMAQQLKHHGKKILHLILIDTFAPGLFGDPSENEVEYFLGFIRDIGGLSNIDLLSYYCKERGMDPNMGIEFIEEDAKKMSDNQRFGILLASMRQANILDSDFDIKYLKQDFEIYKALALAPQNYKKTVRPYEGSVVLLRAADNIKQQQRESNLSRGWINSQVIAKNIKAIKENPLLGWEKYCENVKVHDIFGNHFTMLRPRNVSILAKELERYLLF